MIYYLLYAILGLGLAGPKLVASDWTVRKISLTPESRLTGRLTVEVSNGGTNFDISSEVRLTAVSENFVYHDRLVVIGQVGEQGRASGVVVFDWAGRKVLDWFVCREAMRISEPWIAFVEWYTEHGALWPTDVVLIYDLDK